MPKKIVKITGILLLLLLAFLLTLFSPTIFQEGNPLPVTYGIIKLSITKDAFVKIDKNKYLFRANTEGLKNLTDYLANNNITFVDRAGSGLYFKDKNGTAITASLRMYTRFFEILDF